MKIISINQLSPNNTYLIQYNELKYQGIFLKLHDYNFFYIAEFKDTTLLNPNTPKIPGTTKYFTINNYYFNIIKFFVPEVEKLLLEQTLRQKINDPLCANIISNTIF